MKTSMDIKGLVDDSGVIYDAVHSVPVEFHGKFLCALAELEDNNNHKKNNYPLTHFEVMKGTGSYRVYRFYIDKISGWRCYAQFGNDKKLHLCAISEPKDHDDAMKFISSHKGHFTLK